MTFLRMLESIRTPLGEQIAAAVTLLGEETFFMLIGLALVWCFDKRWGFRLLFVGLTGTVLNQLLIRLGLQDRPINFLADPDHIWLKMCLWNVWKTLGWSSIMYLAAISGIDQTLYEAAKIDGAGRFQIMWHITVPGILETYFVLLLLSIANFISNGMEQYFVFQNAMNRNRIEVLDLYVYNIGLGGGSFSYATAVSILKSIVSLTLLFVANNLSRLVRGNTIL